ncbi:MAG: phosphatidate cytidylyltransferase [Actinomycetota bacterium]|nr:phosphatidate cytidylyltransferase [Actinomycetota bacterium]
MLEERDEPRETDVTGPDRPGDDTRGAAVARPPLHARARIEGVEAGVAAGLVPAGEIEDVAWTAPSGAAAEDGTALDDGDIWIGYGDGDVSVSAALPELPGLPALPDWRDPPTREVPRILLEHPLADPSPQRPGPVWREVGADWDDDDSTFAEIAEEGISVGDHGLSIDEPDPFGFEFEAPVRNSAPPRTEPESRDSPGGPGEPGPPSGVASGGARATSPASPAGVPEVPLGSGWDFSGPVDTTPPLRASRGIHRARTSLLARLRAARSNDDPNAPATREERVPPDGRAAAARVSAGSGGEALSQETHDQEEERARDNVPLGHGTRPAHAVPGRPSRRNPVIATVTGLAFGFGVLGIFLAGPPAVLALVTVVLVAAAAECYQALRHARYRPAVLVGLLGVAAAAITAYLKGPDGVMIVGAAVVVVTLCWYLFGVTRRSPSANFAVTVMVFFWIGALGSFATLLVDPRRFPFRHGLAYFLGAIIATVAYDVGGYAFGSWIGKRPLSPSVSPNKTVEGLLGGCFAAIALSVAVVGHIHPWTVPHALELGIVVAILAPLGDLAESMIKRDLGVKDMGTLLPAHGGILDRIDGLLFVLPATYCLVLLFHG